MAALHKSPFNFSETRQQFEQQQQQPQPQQQQQQSQPPPQAHQNNKSGGGLRSFIHKRNNSDGGNLSSSFAPLRSQATTALSTATSTPVTTTTSSSSPSATAAATTTAAPPPSSPTRRQHSNLPQHESGASSPRRPASVAYPKLQIETQALGHWQQTGSVAIDSPSSPLKSARHDASKPDHADTPRSPFKSNLANLSARFSMDKPRDLPQQQQSQQQQDKQRSSTNLKGLLLSRPRSNKSLTGSNDKDDHQGRDKENRKPSDPKSPALTPIYAQFSKTTLGGTGSVPGSPFDAPADPFTQANLLNLNNSFRPPLSNGVSSGPRPRPQSFQPQHMPRPDLAKMDQDQNSHHHLQQQQQQQQRHRDQRGRLKADEAPEGNRSSTWAKSRSGSRARVISALSSLTGQKPKATSPDPEREPTEPQIDPKDVDKHLEAMLDRRNIPENQRYKMRNLNSTIKMEFIRQDWAEAEGKKLGRRPTNDSDDSTVAASGRDSVRSGDSNAAATAAAAAATDKKHSRGRSFTFSRNSWKIGGSPSKGKKKEVPVKGHGRNKSTDSVVAERPPSANGTYSGTGIIAKVTGQQPSDFVNYLRKVQKPEAVEVGKLHKLRLLLRNERVAWTEDFIKQGGMKEIVGLLQRIMDVEWREEHEDALLHEDLLCLKALCTTALALQYLHEIQATLLPALIHLIFDPEHKGPSEFTTRNIITSILLTYIESGAEQDRAARAQTVLSYLRDPMPKEEERPVDFVLEMRRERPYRVWNKEVVSVTKEVFWIFLHHLNVIALPAGRDKSSEDMRKAATNESSTSRFNDRAITTGLPTDDKYAYMHRHFPQERPPVPAAPYVGGVEWDATNYLASHLDLLNAIIACTPSQAERNELRGLFRVSGWERCMGGSLRLCKEKFYPGVHDALRTWVAAAVDDGWNVRDVRFGPPQESRSTSPKKSVVAPAGGAAGATAAAAKKEAPPRLEMPKLDFMLDGPLSAAP